VNTPYNQNVFQHTIPENHQSPLENLSSKQAANHSSANLAAAIRGAPKLILPLHLQI